MKRAVSLFFILIISVILSAVFVFATEEEFITTEYTYTSTDGSEVTVGLQVIDYNGNGTDIYIPSRIGNLPVIKIGDNFLKNNKTINSVTFSADIKEIGPGAFSGASNMVCALLNNNIEIIGEGAFSNMPAFNSIILWDGIERIGKNAFADCPNLTVYCNENKTGYNYAIENSLKIQLLSDESEPMLFSCDGIDYYIMYNLAYVVRCDDNAENAIIREEINGFPVVIENTKIFSGHKKIKSVEFRNDLTVIAEKMFKDVTTLEKVILPDSVVEIAANAFYNCISLKDINFTDNLRKIDVYAFYNCISLPSVEINENTWLNASAFAGCSGLKYAKFGNHFSYRVFENCTSLEKVSFLDVSANSSTGEAFKGCTDLKSVELLSGSNYVHHQKYGSSVQEFIIPEGVREIAKYTFKDCESLKTIVIPGSVETFQQDYHDEDAIFHSNNLLFVLNDSSAYEYAKKHGIMYYVWDGVGSPDEIELVKYGGIDYLIEDNVARAMACGDDVENAVIPSTVAGYPVIEIRNVFRNNDNIKTVVIEAEKVTGITEYQFEGCDNLESVIAPYVSEIGEYAFADCVSLKTFNSSKSPTVGEYGFYNCKSLKNVSDFGCVFAHSFENCTSLENISLETNECSDAALKGCISLKSFNLGAATTVIPTSFAENCTSLESIGDISGIGRIKKSAFYGCASLTAISLTSDTEYIENKAFGNCDGITSVSLKTSILGKTIWKDDIFAECDNIEMVTYESGSGCTLPLGFSDSVKQIRLDCTSIYNSGSLNENSFTDCSMVRYLKAFPLINDPLQNYAHPSTVWLIEEKKVSQYKNSGVLYFVLDKNGDGLPAFYEDGGIKYYVLNNQAYAVECALDATDVVIKREIQGYPVVAIQDIFKRRFNLKTVTIEAEIKEMSEKMFEGCSSLERVTLPDTITTIPQYAFANSGIIDLDVPKNVILIDDYAFYNCSRLSEISLPETLTNIDAHAFEKCTSLEQISFPEALTAIGAYAFSECSSLNKINWNSTLKNIYTVFNNCTGLTNVEIPANITNMAVAFKGCSNLRNVVIHSGIKTISHEAFYDCTSLETVSFPDTLTNIDARAFYNCKKLKNLHFPESLKEIGPNAFEACSSIEKLICPESLVKIGTSAFQNCQGLEYVSLFDVQLNGFCFADCINLEMLVMRNATRLANFPLENCTGLKTIVFREGTTTLSYIDYKYTPNISKIIIPEGVAEFKAYSLKDLPSLAMVKIPESATTFSHTSLYIDGKLTDVDNTFDESVVLLVYENSPIHKYAEKYKLLYQLINESSSNPEIAYGTSISGTVTYTDGTLAQNVSVELLGDDGEVKGTSTTTSDGKYLFTYAEVGRYTIRANGENDVSFEQVAVKRKNVFDVILTGETDLVLKKGHKVSGTVSGEGSITVTITDTDGIVIDSAVTENGSFEFVNIPNGEYVIKAENDAGSVTVEITVFGGDVVIDDITIEKEAEHATIFGSVVVEGRDNKEYEREWADVTVYNSEGVIVATGKTDENGEYYFENLPLGEYTIKSEVTEMREDKYYGYIRPHILKGYIYFVVAQAGEYEMDTIVLTEEESERVSVSGKVTAQGEHQACDVILMNENRNELARFKTARNGKYQFDNVTDGYYILCAVTANEGAGFAEITVTGGKVYGETDIRVYKSDRISSHELIMAEIPDCNTATEAEEYRETVMAEKTFYDSLPDKEKTMFSEWYIDKLDRLVKLLSGYEITCDGAEVGRAGLIVSEEEVSDGANPHFTIKVVEKDKWEKSQTGIESDEDYYQTLVEEAAGSNKLVQYFDITLECEKNGKTYEITDVRKHTDTTGKIRLTIPIPQQYQGHNKYAFVHVHNGVVTTLVDLDDDPDTITFDIDNFSTFALMYNDEEEIDLSDYATLSVSEGVLTATSTTDATVYVATYADSGVMTALQSIPVYENIPVKVNVAPGQTVFVFDEYMSPLCQKLIVE